jgi:hypothetical protein
VTVTITVTATTNDVPVANDDSPAAIDQGKTLTLAAPGVLANDNDPLKAEIHVNSFTQPAHGTVVVNNNGSLTFTPADDFFGNDSFTYTVSNRTNVSAPATVHLTVNKTTVTPTGDQPPVVTAIGIGATQGAAFSNFNIATFTNSVANRTAADFTAIIDWGDGSSDAGTITQDGSNPALFIVAGGHKYANPGSPTITVLVVDNVNNKFGSNPATASVAAAPTPPSITFALDTPVGSTGNQPVTDNNSPSFKGSGPAGYVVQVMAQKDGSATPVQAALTVIKPDGTWSVSTNPLADGVYSFSVKAFDANSPDTTAQTRDMGRLLIDTQGPKITAISFDTRHGIFHVTYTDNVGLTGSALLNRFVYSYNQGKKRSLHPTSVTDETPAGTPGNVHMVAVKLGNGRKVKRGPYNISIDSVHAPDSAGNALDGEFRGSLPSGNGVAGGLFQAAFIVKGNRARGPKPVTVITGKSFPANPAVHTFAVHSAARGRKAVHATSLGGFSLKRGAH